MVFKHKHINQLERFVCFLLKFNRVLLTYLKIQSTRRAPIRSFRCTWTFTRLLNRKYPVDVVNYVRLCFWPQKTSPVGINVMLLLLKFNGDLLRISRWQSIRTSIVRFVRYTDIWPKTRKYQLYVILCADQYLWNLYHWEFNPFVNCWSVTESSIQISRIQSIRIGELLLYKGGFRQCHKACKMVRKSL